ncbi:GNAT family N-acetyltransferase [Cellvibrio sp. NN19]|uniref:GNAT family N-acetyltransferase n=1 Tax=Cellvibrio chitinivorans TaxID=3102792 RepID=UPI002B400AB0|nr:GNAT family N-acetyltransferase [Cellvibrio sp. NN19]
MHNLPELPDGFVLRDIIAADHSFLLALFRSTREQLAYLPLAAAQLDMLYEQQYQLQQHFYTQQFPQAWHWLVEVKGECAGKLVVNPGEGWVHLVDISLIPHARGQGLGQQLLKALQVWAESQGCGISLQVDRHNLRAKNLYLSLGFREVLQGETHERLCWQALSVNSVEI